MKHEGGSSILAIEARKRPRVGDLYFLGHPGTPDTFSGYGLITGEGQGNHLAGLLMVDRPHTVDPQWLARIEEVYGDYLLVPMTASGERGIACQMWVAADSLPFLRHSPQGGRSRRPCGHCWMHRPTPF
jgi:hypothetical protein